MGLAAAASAFPPTTPHTRRLRRQHERNHNLRLLSSLVMTLLGAGLLAAAGIAATTDAHATDSTVAKPNRGGTLRIDSRNDFDFVDPTLSYFSHSLQLQHATQLKLISSPDPDGPAGDRMVPQAAAGFPKVSGD